MSYHIKRREKFLATTAILGSLSFYATEAQAACTETFAGSGIWDCSGVNVTTQSPTSAVGGALDVSTSGAMSIITPAGDALNLTNAIGDTNINYLDVFTSTITGNDNGIISINNGTGNTSLISAADITGTTLDAINVDNTAAGSDIDITTNGNVLGDDRGIKANNDGTGTTSIITTGTVTGTTAEAINVSNTGTATNISVNTGAGAITGATMGIDVNNSGTGTTSVVTSGAVTGTSDHAITILQDTGTSGVTVNTGAGTLSGGRKAISIDNDGNGATSVTTAGTVIGTTEDAIYIDNAATTAGATVNANSGTVTGHTNGIYIDHKGAEAAAITGAANITGTTLDGIFIDNTAIGTNIFITTNGSVLGDDRGIKANNDGTGTTSIITTGTVTGTTAEAINVSNTGTATNISVNTGAGAITGATMGIDVNNSGTGTTSVVTSGAVTGTSDHAITILQDTGTSGVTVNTGAGTLSGGRKAISINNDGNGATSVTTAGTVTGTTEDAIYIDNAATTTGATVNAATGTITGNTNGIFIDHKGSGATVITGAADITGTTLDAINVDNTAAGSDIDITTNGNVLGDDRGIKANNDGTGTTSIITTGTVTGTTAEAINVSNTGTATNISVNTGAGAITGATMGIDVNNSGTGTTSVVTSGAVTGTSDHAITILQDTGTSGVTVNTGAGTLSGGRKAISINNDGNGATSVTTAGTVIGTTEDAIYIDNAATTAGATVNANSGTVTGHTNGIYIDHKGAEAAAITGAANITGTTLDGIFIDNTAIGTNIFITTNGSVLGDDRGIKANNDGTGTTSIITTGTVTGTTAEAINVSNTGTATNISVNTGAGAITGATMGIDVNNSGTGTTSVVTSGAVTGTSDHAITILQDTGTSGVTVNTGAGTLSGGRKAISINNDGNGATSVTTAGTVTGTTEDAIYIDNAATTTGATVNAATGTITGNTNGIFIDHKGSGATVITGAADITGTTLDAINVDNTAAGSDIDITTNGNVLGDDRGIKANNDGTGTTSIITTGTVTGTTAEAILVENNGTSTSLTVNAGAGAVSGKTYGIYADNDGNGATSITTTGIISATDNDGIMALGLLNSDQMTIDAGAGTITGGEHGIYANHSGAGAVSVTSSGTVTGIETAGIRAFGSNNTTDILINGGAGTINGGLYGIHTEHNGTGALNITTAGVIDGATEYGIRGYSSGSNQTINTGAGAVSGGKVAIHAQHLGSGDLLISTVGSVTGVAQQGIYAFNSAISEDLMVDTGAGTVTGNTTGIHANSLSAGDISISTTSTIIGTTEHGLYVDHDGTGSSSMNVMGVVMAAKNALYAEHSVTATDMTIISGAGNIDGGFSGIFATNLGSGTTTVTTGSGTVTGAADHGVYALGHGTNVTINTGTGEITGNTHATYADNSGSGDTVVTTSGAVSGTVNGITVTNNVTSNDITITTGAGTVSAATIGISAVNNGSGSTTINTVGDVTATSGTGISAANAGTPLSINVNSGTISGAINGIHATNTGSGRTTITNASTISGGTNSILIGGGSTTVNNSGTLDGDVIFDAGDDTLSLDAGSTFSSNAVGGAGEDALNVVGDHTLGTITEFETVNISDGTVLWDSTASNVGELTLNNANLSFGGVAGSVSLDVNSMLSGTGSLADLIISGIISPGNSAGTINVAGNYTMENTAVYHAEIYADGTGDLIDVAGAVALNGKLEIAIKDDPEEYDIKGIYTVLSADGPITGDFTTVTSENTTTTLYVMHHLRNNNVEVDFINPTEYFAPAGETSNQKAASVILPHLAINSDEAEKLFHADDLEVNEKLEELSGNRHATMAGIIASDATEYMKTVVSQVDAVGQGNVNSWMNSFGLDSKAKTDGNARGYDHVSKGVSFGLGLGLFNTITAGVHGGMTWSDTSFDADKGEGRSKEAGAYIAGDFKVLNFVAAYSHGWHDVKMNRYMNLLGTAQNVADTKSHKFEFDAGIPLQVNQITIEPAGGINHTKVNGMSINETGATIGNLEGATKEFTSTQVHGGLRLSAQLPTGNSGVITPSVKVKYVRQIGDIRGIMTTSFEAVPTTEITSHGLSNDKNRIEVDAGINFRTKGNLSFNLGYRGIFAKNLKSHGGRAGISLTF